MELISETITTYLIAFPADGKIALFCFLYVWNVFLRHWPHLQPMQATPLLTASHRILSSVARLLRGMGLENIFTSRRLSHRLVSVKREIKRELLLVGL